MIGDIMKISQTFVALLSLLLIACERSVEQTANASESETAAETTTVDIIDVGASADNLDLQKIGSYDDIRAVEPFGVIVEGAIWRFEPGEPKVVIVCWIGPDEKFTQEKTLIRETIDETWGQASALRFAYWGECTADRSPAVRIRLTDHKGSPYAYALGRKLYDYGHKGLYLNVEWKVHHEEWGDDWPFDNCTHPDNRNDCIKASAIHEFGHVAGIHHEQKHPKAPSECKEQFKRAEQRELNPGEAAVTPFDPASVMNYCRRDRMKALTLSDLDKKTIELLYCKKGESNCPGYSKRAITN